MLQHLAAILGTFVELLQVEAERLKLSLTTLLISAALLLVVALFSGLAMLAGGLWAVWSLHLAIAPHVGAAWSALICAATLWLVGGGGLWLAIRKVKRNSKPVQNS